MLTGTAPNLVYKPATNYFGDDTLWFKVNDGTVDSSLAVISLTVTPVNDAPTGAPAVSGVPAGGQASAHAFAVPPTDDAVLDPLERSDEEAEDDRLVDDYVDQWPLL